MGCDGEICKGDGDDDDDDDDDGDDDDNDDDTDNNIKIHNKNNAINKTFTQYHTQPHTFCTGGLGNGASHNNEPCHSREVPQHWHAKHSNGIKV